MGLTSAYCCDNAAAQSTRRNSTQVHGTLWDVLDQCCTNKWGKSKETRRKHVVLPWWGSAVEPSSCTLLIAAIRTPKNNQKWGIVSAPQVKQLQKLTSDCFKSTKVRKMELHGFFQSFWWRKKKREWSGPGRNGASTPLHSSTSICESCCTQDPCPGDECGHGVRGDWFEASSITFQLGVRGWAPRRAEGALLPSIGGQWVQKCCGFFDQPHYTTNATRIVDYNSQLSNMTLNKRWCWHVQFQQWVAFRLLNDFFYCSGISYTQDRTIVQSIYKRVLIKCAACSAKHKTAQTRDKTEL